MLQSRRADCGEHCCSMKGPNVMPHWLSELQEMAQRGRPTPEESEDLATMLNAPVMPPAGHAVGFVSKHTFEPSDLPARIAAIRWFSKCREPLTLDLTMEV